MIVQTWTQALQDSFNNVLQSTVSFIPNFVFAVVLFVIGWVIGVWLEWVVEQVVKAIRVDMALRSAGVEAIVNRAGYRLDSGAFLGALIKWFVIVVFLWAALMALNLVAVTGFLQFALVPFLGRVIVAVLIILIAAVVAETMQNIVVGAARAANVASAGFAGTVTRWAIWVVAILAALDQLGVTPFFQQILLGIITALALAFGLAFGLGGQESAARFLERVRESIKSHRM